jgi:hypothetical protein
MRYTKPQILDSARAGRMVQQNEAPKGAMLTDSSHEASSQNPPAYEADE